MSPLARSLLSRRSLGLFRRASALGCARQRCSGSLEYASSCYLPTTWLDLPLVAKREHNHDSTLYSFGLPEGDHTPTLTPTHTPTHAPIHTPIHTPAHAPIHAPARSRRSRRSSPPFPAACQARRSTCPRARACCCACRARPTTPCARTRPSPRRRGAAPLTCSLCLPHISPVSPRRGAAPLTCS